MLLNLNTKFFLYIYLVCKCTDNLYVYLYLFLNKYSNMHLSSGVMSYLMFVSDCIKLWIRIDLEHGVIKRTMVYITLECYRWFTCHVYIKKIIKKNNKCLKNRIQLNNVDMVQTRMYKGSFKWISDLYLNAEMDLPSDSNS